MVNRATRQNIIMANRRGALRELLKAAGRGIDLGMDIDDNASVSMVIGGPNGLGTCILILAMSAWL